MLRVPVEEMAPLEKAAHTLGVDVHGLKCDTPDCGWSDMTIPLDAYLSHLPTKCPNCGEHVLTRNDLTMVMALIFGAAAQTYANNAKSKEMIDGFYQGSA